MGRAAATAPRLALALGVILLAGRFAAAASDATEAVFACDGCPLQTYPVCGQDGEWYQNGCMAYCAGVARDASERACAGTPMPFEDRKPGPHGAESGAEDGVISLIDRAVINAFKSEGLRYVGRIRLAKELAPRPADAEQALKQPEPDVDEKGNWKVDALRCTADGDVYRGTMRIPRVRLEINAAAPARPLASWFRPLGPKKSGSDSSAGRGRG